LLPDHFSKAAEEAGFKAVGFEELDRSRPGRDNRPGQAALPLMIKKIFAATFRILENSGLIVISDRPE
jgi:hypothetical protein